MTTEVAPDPSAPAATSIEAEESVSGIVEPEAAGGQAAETGAVATPQKRRRRLPLPGLRTPLGIVVVFMLVAGFGSIATVGGVVAVNWTETPDFCGRCHTMAPEMKAFSMGPHRDLTCAECHVEPGVLGWVKAKVKGTQQLFEILTGTFPRPIPAPDHGELPSVAFSCEKCHNVNNLTANGGPVQLVLQNKYALDESNTKSMVALVVRPQGIGGPGATKGVHWHIASDVEYLRADLQAQKIDYVKVTWSDGTSEEYVSAGALKAAERPDAAIATLKATETQRRMDCIDCHNRAGHGVPSVASAIDSAIDQGQISQSLPYVKREAMDRLSLRYASDADAEQAIDQLKDFYAQQYPLIAASDGTQIESAISEIKTIYRLIATPDMLVEAQTYPSNLGHQSAPGCFRCHDGAHYRVVDGEVTDETIPSTCSTCHTFPQIGPVQAAVLIGDRPDSHADKLWVFNHGKVARTTPGNPAGTQCAACHTQTYCQNCHSTKAVQVPHDNMLTNHAAVARQLGTAACTICHQAPYCAQCHAQKVLPDQVPDLVTPIGPTGELRWPIGLVADRRW
ncbi:MAG TPA: NapC/NirT family cytochrome c [Candidatus Limnocylindrales bacterium]